MFGTVYKITCARSGKAYVGQTSKTLEHRLREHFNITSRKGYAFGAAIRKYGREAFTIEPLEHCESLEALNLAEQRWIAVCGTLAPAGYNVASGGRVFRHAESSKAKMSASTRRCAADPAWRAKISATKQASGYTHSEATRLKMSKAKQGKPARNKGQPMSDAQRAKLRAAWVIRKARAAQ